MKLNNYFSLDNIKISDIDLDNFKEIAGSMIRTGSVNQIISMNLDSLRNSSKNDEFRRICLSNEFIIPDSIGVTSLIFFKYGRTTGRITGFRIFQTLLEIAEKMGLRIALLGSSGDVQSKLRSGIESQYKNIVICASLAPPYLFEKDEKVNREIVEKLKESKPDLLIVALGNPRQEIWIAENMRSIGAKINVGLGAVFDFYSGSKKRAPLFFRSIGAEWIWRLFSEPRRLFKRYLFDDLSYYIRSAGRIISKKY